MTFCLTITLKGTPRALPRARHIPGRKRPVSITGKAKAYATALQRAARAAVLAVGEDTIRQEFAGKALALTALFEFPTPKAERWGRGHVFKPDRDNLEKMLSDCLAKAGAFGGDDCKIAATISFKRWGPAGRMDCRVEVMTETARRDAARLIADPLVGGIPSWLR